MMDYEVKTSLSEGQYKAMMEVMGANGMTQAGYLRHLILQDIYKSQDLVEQMQRITLRAENARK